MKALLLSLTLPHAISFRTPHQQVKSFGPGRGAGTRACRVHTPVDACFSWKLATRDKPPHAMVAAPAMARSPSSIVVLGGDDGELAFRIEESRERHPGFRNEIYEFRTDRQQWSRVMLPLTRSGGTGRPARTGGPLHQ